MSGGHKPTAIELFTNPHKLRLRPSRKSNKKKDESSPLGEVVGGSTVIALGVAAITFASRSMNRVRLERSLIAKMWKKKTTVEGLLEAAKAGEALPETVLVKGMLTAQGPPVKSITAQVPQLMPFMGQINQPPNFFDSMAVNFENKKLKLPKNIKVDDIERVVDDYSVRQTVLQENLIISELLITRLGCEADKTVTKDDDGNRKVKITRSARKARFNILHHRQVSEGLELVDTKGEKASVVLQKYGDEELRNNDSPSLFLSLPDAMNEFKRWQIAVGPYKNIGNADKALTHLSKFIFFDRTSDTDHGAYKQSESDIEDSALDDIAKIVPQQWLWSGKGFYDNNLNDRFSYPDVEKVDYAEFKQRISVASRENAKWQEATEWDSAEMMRKRDKENSFRVAELGIANESEVVVLAKPQLAMGSVENEADSQGNSSNKLILMPPDQPAWDDITTPRFNLRILHGHTVDNLMKHRMLSLRVYLGLAAMGVCTVEFGEQLLRDGLVIVA